MQDLRPSFEGKITVPLFTIMRSNFLEARRDGLRYDNCDVSLALIGATDSLFAVDSSRWSSTHRMCLPFALRAMDFLLAGTFAKFHPISPRAMRPLTSCGAKPTAFHQRPS